MSDNKITPDDIANKFGDLKDELESAGEAAKDVAVKAGIVVAVIVVILAFLLGSRRGKQGRTVVEVRRI